MALFLVKTFDFQSLRNKIKLAESYAPDKKLFSRRWSLKFYSNREKKTSKNAKFTWKNLYLVWSTSLVLVGFPVQSSFYVLTLRTKIHIALKRESRADPSRMSLFLELGDFFPKPNIRCFCSEVYSVKSHYHMFCITIFRTSKKLKLVGPAPRSTLVLKVVECSFDFVFRVRHKSEQVNGMKVCFESLCFEWFLLHLGGQLLCICKLNWQKHL